MHRYTGEKMPITKILRDIAGNDDNLRSLRQVIGAAIRSGESWEKIVVFYNEHGATGKSTAGVARESGACTMRRVSAITRSL